jgi:hypothetical protein
MMNRLQTRWIIFAGLFVTVLISYMLSVPMSTKASPSVRKSYDYLESLPPSSVIVFSFDHEASSLPEIQPIALAMLRHAFRNDLKIIGLSLFAEGTAIGYQLLNKTAAEFGKVYGKDYVFLGFKPQHISAILGMGESIERVFPEDYLGNPVGSLELMKGISNYGQIDVVISIADGDRAVQWIEYAGATYGQRIMAGLTAAMITSYDPYLASGQLYSAVGGLKGAAEYENLYGCKGGGNRGMLAQSAAHVYLLLLIIIGNIIHLKTRERKSRK